jgi:AcrR family transcriptional regulator
MGRPREFDRGDALQTAMRLFWRNGFEGVGVTDLMEAMNISPPSFYAAFGSKTDLYREALAVYVNRPRAVSPRLLAGDVPITVAIRTLLRAAIYTVTELTPAAGCMIANGLLAVGPGHRDLAELTASLRRDLVLALERRLEQAVEGGELGTGVQPASLARYFATIVQGISVQAHDGASKKELEGIVAQALDTLKWQVVIIPYHSVRQYGLRTDLSNPTKRAGLVERREPYWERLSKGCALGFRRGPDTWIARYTRKNGKKTYRALGKIADYNAAKYAAKRWCSQFAGSPATTVDRHKTPAAQN